MRDNYCRVLGINPFVELDYRDISDIIDAKALEWEQDLVKRNSDRTRHRSASCLARLPDMRAVMSNPVLRRNEFEEGAKEVNRIASHLLRCTVVSRDGRAAVIPSLQKRLADTTAWGGVGPDVLLQASGIGDYAIPEPADEGVVRMYRMLSALGLYTPYEFVNYILAVPGLGFDFQPLDDDSPADTFFADADMIYSRKDRLAARNPAEGELLGKIAVHLHDVRTSKVLNDMIIYGRTMEKLVPVMETMDLDSGSMFTSEYTDSILASLIADGVEDSSLAIAILERYCYVRGYPADFSGNRSAVEICPSCRGITAVGRGLSRCSLCGAPVRVACPACGTVIGAQDRICRECGADLTEADIEISEGRARIDSLIAGGSAEQALQAAEELRSHYPYAQGLTETAEEASETYARLQDIRQQVADCSNFGRPYALKSFVEASLESFPFLTDDPEIGPLYLAAKDAVQKADELCRGNAYGSVEGFIGAAEVCPDHPVALSKLRTMVPEGPADGSAEDGEGGIVVRYAVPEDRRGMVFRIYRGLGADPEVNTETVPLAETAQGVYVDTTADPGVPYYYRVYVIRWGVLSEEYASAGPAVMVREVTNVTITPLEDGLRADYDIPAGARRVRVWRKVAGLPSGEGEETEIDAGYGSFTDTGLRGEETYSYLFVAEFDNGYRSRGTVFRGTTPAYPEPIQDMTVEWDRGTRLYRAKWSAPSKAVLYRSSFHPQFAGRAVRMDDLDSWLQRIECESSEGEADFPLPAGYAHFITPVVRCGETGIVGNVTLITNLRPLTDVSKRTEDGVCTLTFPWPEGAVAVVVKSGDESVMIDRPPGEKEGSVKVPMGSTNRRQVSLTAVYDVDGARMSSLSTCNDVWQVGASLITYEITSAPQQSDPSKQEVSFTVHCPGTNAIPRMRMVMADRGIPLRPNDGIVVWRSDDPFLLANGVGYGGFFMDRKAADISRMRLFFEDRSVYARYRVVHPTGRK